MKPKHILSVVVAGCLCHGLLGCATIPTPPAPLSPMARAAMQTKELNGSFDTAYKATLSVLQDQGWQIEEADKDSGLIQASSTRHRDVIGPENDYRATDKMIEKTRIKMAKFKGNSKVAPAMWTRWQQITATIEPWGKGTVRERLTIVNCGSLPSGLHYYPYPRAFGYSSSKVQETAQEQSVVVEDPQAYQLLFQQVQKAIFVRQNL